jgi:hypothetical protein
MLEIIERPLTSNEYFQLQTRLQTARDESGKALLKSGTASAVVCHVLMLLTLLVTPERVISAAIKNGVELPEHLSIVPAPLDRIESALRSQ